MKSLTKSLFATVAGVIVGMTTISVFIQFFGSQLGIENIPF